MFRKFFREKGAATIILTVILMFISTIIVIFGTSINIPRVKISANQLRKSEAFQAAEAGLNFGMQYLLANSTAIIVPNESTGFIANFSNSATTNVVLANNSTYTITYTNTVPFDYSLIRVTSVGRSSDASSVKTVQQIVKIASALTTTPKFSFITLGSLSLTGNAKIINGEDNKSIQAAGAVTMTGNAGTQTPSGGSSSSQNGNDITQNDPALSGLTALQLFQTFFNTTPDAFKSSAVNSLTSSTASSADGMMNTTIYIEGNTNFAANSQIGTPSAPVFMFVNGNLNLSGNTKLYGMIFVNGMLSTSGNAQVYGSITNSSVPEVDSDLAATSEGNSVLNYDSTILEKVKSMESLRTLSKVPGSWKDF